VKKVTMVEEVKEESITPGYQPVKAQPNTLDFESTSG
jgi:hypothetical protein